jgi:nitrile hydratase
MSDPDHHHQHDHDHEESGIALRVKSMEQILVEKGLIDPEAIDGFVDMYENQIGPQNGAKVVAKAWNDPDYKLRLLSDATSAIAELGYQGLQGDNMVVLENTRDHHHVVVCTLCSCYPWPVLGLPPVWYKSPEYRARVVREPRKVLEDFGTKLPSSTRISVWDSSAEIRYMVLPQRPADTGGMSEEELTALVTRDSMIGVTTL